jgi:hypothetical protein
LPTLLRLAAPNVLNLLAFAGVITFDGFFLGRIGTNALAGASLAFPWVMMVLQTTNSGMGAGVSSAVARALGAGRRDRADVLVFHAFLLALAVAVRAATWCALRRTAQHGWPAPKKARRSGRFGRSRGAPCPPGGRAQRLDKASSSEAERRRKPGGCKEARRAEICALSAAGANDNFLAKP